MKDKIIARKKYMAPEVFHLGVEKDNFLITMKIKF